MFGDQGSSRGSAFETVRPYVDRAIEDEEIRANVLRAWRAARSVYRELGGENPVDAADKLRKDRDAVRENLDTTVQSLSEAIVRMSGQQRRSRSGWGMLLLAVGVIVVLFNPATGAGTRAWLKDTFLGSEEEFDYGTPNY